MRIACTLRILLARSRRKAASARQQTTVKLKLAKRRHCLLALVIFQKCKINPEPVKIYDYLPIHRYQQLPNKYTCPTQLLED